MYCIAICTGYVWMYSVASYIDTCIYVYVWMYTVPAIWRQDSINYKIFEDNLIWTDIMYNWTWIDI